jgi:hypothetical protein
MAKKQVVTRHRRPLSHEERRVQHWLKSNHGILSQVARDCDVSVQFVHRIAYNREAQSRGLRVEKKLAGLGCPLMQKVY